MNIGKNLTLNYIGKPIKLITEFYDEKGENNDNREEENDKRRVKNKNLFMHRE